MLNPKNSLVSIRTIKFGLHIFPQVTLLQLYCFLEKNYEIKLRMSELCKNVIVELYNIKTRLFL